MASGRTVLHQGGNRESLNKLLVNFYLPIKASLLLFAEKVCVADYATFFFIGSYNLDSTVTVSGLSSGAYMANQFHVAHSGKVTGAAIFAGGKYTFRANSWREAGWSSWYAQM